MEAIMKQAIQAVLVAHLGVVAMAVVSGPVQAAGFALIEQGASGMGNAFAGAAALGEDATTVFFNPAGMTRLGRAEVIAGGSAVNVQAEFSGTSTRPAAMGGGTNTGGLGGDPGGLAGVPNLYMAMPLNERVAIGLGVGVPFGLQTEYDSDWVGRYQGIKSALKTININPSVAYKVSESLSVGIGLNYQRIDVELTNAVVLGAVTEGRARLSADDDSWGWNTGVLWQAAPGTRIGVSYRSGIRHEMNGDATTTTLGGTVVSAASGAARAVAELPATYSLSLVQAVAPAIDILADVTFTQWSNIQQITVVNPSSGAARDILAFDFDNSWRFSLGANYRMSDVWLLRVGVAHDISPVKSAQHRTVRLPDADRTWLSLGARWTLSPTSAVDLAYAHLFLQDVDVNFTRGQLVSGTTSVNPATVSTVSGSYTGSVDILSVQYVHRF
jgi:long-chain fatty acid transport protein